MARKFKKLDRQKAKREPPVRFVLVCEGKNTEPRYFKALERQHNNVLIEIETIEAAGVPSTVASRAIAEVQKINRTDPLEEDDQVWAVFDKDEHPCFEKAIEQCNGNGVGIARSDPCFEVWLILHFESYDRAGTRRDAYRKLKALCNGADCKHHSFDYTEMVGNFEFAVTLAQRQEKSRIKEGGLTPPYTTVHKLASALNVYFKK